MLRVETLIAEVKYVLDNVTHDLATCRQMMADAALIEARAEVRLADEYDAAQARSEVMKRGAVGTKVLDENFTQASQKDIGLTKAQVHKARKTRDAGRLIPASSSARWTMH